MRKRLAWELELATGVWWQIHSAFTAWRSTRRQVLAVNRVNGARQSWRSLVARDRHSARKET